MKRFILFLFAFFALSFVTNANTEVTAKPKPQTSFKRGFDYRKAQAKANRYNFFHKHTLRKRNGGCDWAR